MKIFNLVKEFLANFHPFSKYEFTACEIGDQLMNNKMIPIPI